MFNPADNRVEPDNISLRIGDSAEVLRQFAECSIDACVTDPPYALTSIVKRFGGNRSAPAQEGNDGRFQRLSGGFMGKQWDSALPSAELWQEVYRVLKPGAYLLAFGGTRTFHRLVCSIEDAGFDIRDTVAWVYGCLSDDTEILTKGGWVHYHKLTEGCPVLGYNVDKNTYEWMPIQEIFVYDYRDTAYRLHSDRTDQLVSRNHRCIIERNGKRIFQLAEQIAWERKARVPILEDVSGLLKQRSQKVRGERFTVSDLVTITPVHYEGKVWCVRVHSGAFVVRRNGHVFVTGNSGFPKSHDVSKAIDKAAGAEREIVGQRVQKNDRDANNLKMGRVSDVFDITAPATDAARQWQGWGTALKPAFEPICMARKPLVGTVAENVMAYGTGGINIDGCRVQCAEQSPTAKRRAYGFTTNTEKARDSELYGKMRDRTDPLKRAMPHPSDEMGRWPANLIHDGSEEVLAGFSSTPPSKSSMRGVGFSSSAVYGDGDQDFDTMRGYTDAGGSAARFFYCAKAQTGERGDANTHPTVKPVALMRWLCRMVTQPGGIVLDPFMGSGSTGIACVQEGFRFIGIDREQEYYEIALRRVREAKTSATVVMQF